MRLVLKFFAFLVLALALFGLEQFLLNDYQPCVSVQTVANPLYAHLAYAGVVFFIGMVIFWPELDFCWRRRKSVE